MTDKPQWKPSKGLFYIKDIPVGQLVEVGSQKAIVVQHTDVSTVIHCVESKSQESQFYLGRHRWANTTEVKQL